MSDKETGGPAFPVFREQYSHGIGEKAMHTEFGGMTLRDYFAAKAMQAITASEEYQNGNWANSVIAEQSYQLADAMLKAREE